MNEVAARIGDADVADTRLEPAALAKLVAMVEAGEVAQSAAKEVLDELGRERRESRTRSWRRAGSAAPASGELEQIVERAMTENADAVEKIRAGNDKAIGAVVGAVMRETKGRADGGEVQRMIRERV